MKTDPKLARPAEAIAADYRAFGLSRSDALNRLARATTARQRLRLHYGAVVNPKTGVVGPHVTHREFAEKDRAFRRACAYAHIEPTRRQASKWRRGHGLARDAAYAMTLETAS